MNISIPFQHVRETGSTNQDLLDLVASGASAPAAILADHQTAGRGRLGRHWLSDRAHDSPVQAMLGSVRVDWRPNDSAMGLTPFAAGLAVVGAANRWVDDPDVLALKWPNDIVIENSGYLDDPALIPEWFLKVGGILVEAVPLPGSGTAVVVGAGVNIWPVTSTGEGFRPRDSASLESLCSTVPTNVELFRAFLDEFARYNDLLRSDPSGLLETYRQKCATTGHTVRFVLGSGPVVAEAEQVNDDGSLQVIEPDGTRHTVTAGDVMITRP